MTPETTDARLRDLEADAFRTGRTLAEHSEKLADIESQQRTAFSNIDSLGDAIGAPGDRSLTQRLQSLEDDVREVKSDVREIHNELGDVKRLLTALAQAQGIHPDNA
ncbi:hypothetical protein GCM10018785_45230 [Streptomyces longispororuber]|uniref:Uncharacterized protein n=1 Tax=Streptomyces longispororuber TaxID=68230 RepID=A0A918ZWF6_9ACTN|nr:hypothetical protein [Streptomyces longispororuber]GHE71926.1 hypothetical protein GCM10018785_45230 [Streptomyces longispororuber]